MKWHIGVVGAGLLGCALAWLLSRSFRIKVSVYEKRALWLRPYPELPLWLSEEEEKGLSEVVESPEALNGRATSFLTQAFVRAANEEGVAFHFNTSLLEVEREGDSWLLETSQGRESVHFLCFAVGRHSYQFQLGGDGAEREALPLAKVGVQPVFYWRGQREEEVSLEAPWQWVPQQGGELGFLLGPWRQSVPAGPFYLRSEEVQRALSLGQQIFKEGAACLDFWGRPLMLEEAELTWGKGWSYTPTPSSPLETVLLARRWSAEVGQKLGLPQGRPRGAEKLKVPPPVEEGPLVCPCTGVRVGELLRHGADVPSVEGLLHHLQIPLRGCELSCCSAQVETFLARRGRTWL